MLRTAAVLLLVIALPARGTTLPAGLVHEQLVGEPFGTSPVGFCFLPDERFVLIEQQSGTVRVAPAGSAVSDSIFTLPDSRGDHPERGLLGVVADPDWPLRPYLYFHYTAVDSTVKVVMYEAGGDLAVPTSSGLTLSNRYVLLDSIDDDANIHNAGTVRFAPDGMLLVSVGDDAKACQAQDSTSALGKILRLDVADLPGPGVGPPAIADLAPADNPFPTTAGYGPLVYAWGLRNPFRFTVDGTSGDVFIGSVGSHLFEEINRIPAAGSAAPNFGWPQWEGDQQIFCCGTCGETNPFTDPIHQIPHPLEVISVIGGPRIRSVSTSPVSLPSPYEGDVLFAEIFSGTITRLRETGGAWDVAPPAPGQADPLRWGEGFIGASDLQLGEDGAVYLVSLGLNANFLPRGLHRIRADPSVVPAPLRPADTTHAVTVEPNPVRLGGSVRFRFHVPTRESATVRIVSASGRVLRSLEDAQTAPGNRTLRFDGRTDSGAPLPAGVHFVEVSTPSGFRARGRAVWIP
ncbi:MAG: hypothetical protein DHS20C21_11530 [Gemmatimonadota bacterium]|nr:MAG: hypothetical protein DHS20C21_11530 [Gemmatimonadota bacterium]